MINSEAKKIGTETEKVFVEYKGIEFGPLVNTEADKMVLFEHPKVEVYRGNLDQNFFVFYFCFCLLKTKEK